jgi:hypothetical protein
MDSLLMVRATLEMPLCGVRADLQVAFLIDVFR